MSVVLILSLLMTISTSVKADEGTNIQGYNTTENGTKDMAKFTFVKVFEMLGDTANGEFPNESFTIHFNPHKVKGLPTNSTITDATMPTIDSVQIKSETIKETDFTDENGKHFKQMEVEVTLPTYEEIGDYWYTVSESVLDDAGDDHDVAGVTHDPNTYYLHVQVVLDPGNDNKIARLVTLHKPDPKDQSTYIAAKTNGVTNVYGNGSLIIKKIVNGTAADAEKPFDMVVTFSSKAPVSSDITYKFFNNTSGVQVDSDVVIKHAEWKHEGENYTLSKTVEITANKRVAFYNLPFGVTYTVQEKNYESSYKVPIYNIDSDPSMESEDTIEGAHLADWDDKYVKGTITDVEDTVSVINTTDATIDVGVIIDNLPYIVIMLFVIGAIVVFVTTRRKKEIVD